MGRLIVLSCVGVMLNMNGEASSEPQHTVLSGQQNPATWVSHPVDVRISVPFLHTRFYLTIVAGRERRPSHRRMAERQDCPILTIGNALFAFGLTTLVTLVALSILIARSAIIE